MPPSNRTRRVSKSFRPATIARPARVLIVEDEHLIQLMLAEMITHMGYAVAGVAGNLKEAEDHASGMELDVAVLDINLAGEKVFPVADTLKARGVPFCFVTGYGVAGLPAHYELSAVLQKPFQEEDLEKILRSLCALTKNIPAHSGQPE
jgi:DNA-binding response OmpR family regulator